MSSPEDVAQELMARFEYVNSDTASPYRMEDELTKPALNEAMFRITTDDGRLYEVSVREENE